MRAEFLYPGRLKIIDADEPVEKGERQVYAES